MATATATKNLAAFKERKNLRITPIKKRRLGKRLELLSKDPQPKAQEQMFSILSSITTSSPAKLLLAIVGDREEVGEFFNPRLVPSEEVHYLRTKHFAKLASLGLIYHEQKNCLLGSSAGFVLGSVHGFLLEDSSALGGYAGSTFNTRILVTLTSQHILQHELQHAFDSLFGIGKENGSGEYRAELAALAFSESETSKIFQAFLFKSRFPEDPFSVYVKAASRIISELKNEFGYSWWKLVDLSEDVSFLEKVRAHSLELLDREYQNRLGITYSALLNTFSQDI